MNCRIFACLLLAVFLAILLSGCVNLPACGNNVCEIGENHENCPVDCLKPECGNSECEPGENCENCPSDCGECLAECGNGICEAGETMQNCPQDCAEQKIEISGEWVTESEEGIIEGDNQIVIGG